MARKPRMFVAIALANKMARSFWAMLTKDEDYGLLRLLRSEQMRGSRNQGNVGRVRRSSNGKGK